MKDLTQIAQNYTDCFVHAIENFQGVTLICENL